MRIENSLTASAPAIAGEGDHAERGGGGAGLNATQTTQGDFSADADCPATPPTRRVPRPLHHGSLASRAPVVPLPRYRGGGKLERSRSRGALRTRVLRQERKPLMFRLQTNKGRRSAGRRKRNRPRHTNRCHHLPALRARRAPRTIRLREPPASGALTFRRSTTALTEVSRPRLSTSGQVSWDAAVGGRYPPCACPSPAEAPRAPAVIPADMMPEAARERFARPPAGTALTPPSGSHPECALRWARLSFYNRNRDRCQARCRPIRDDKLRSGAQ